MNNEQESPIAQALLQKYKERKKLVGYPFLEWSGRLLTFLAYLSVVVAVVSVYKTLSASSNHLGADEKTLYVFVGIVSGMVSFVLLQGLASACYVLLDLWKDRKQCQ